MTDCYSIHRRHYQRAPPGRCRRAACNTWHPHHARAAQPLHVTIVLEAVFPDASSAEERGFIIAHWGPRTWLIPGLLAVTIHRT